MMRINLRRLAALLTVVLAASLAAPLVSAQTSEAELVFWQTVADTDSKEMYEAYLAAFPDGAFRPLAEIRMRELEEAAQDAAASVLRECDALAGHRLDPTLTEKPVPFAELEQHAHDALTTCRQAFDETQSPRAAFQIARTLLALGQKEEAGTQYLAAAEMGHIRARYRVGIMYEEGFYGRQRDLVLARTYFAPLATKDGYPPAFTKLGVFDLFGWGQPNKDELQARIWFKKALNAEIPESHYWLGRIYMDGLGVEPDLERAQAFLTDSREIAPAFQKNDVTDRLIRLKYEFVMQDILEIPDFFDRTLAAAEVTPDLLAELGEITTDADEYREVLASASTELDKQLDTITRWIDFDSDLVTPLQVDAFSASTERLAVALARMSLARYERFPDQPTRYPRAEGAETARELRTKVQEFPLAIRLDKQEREAIDPLAIRLDKQEREAIDAEFDSGRNCMDFGSREFDTTAYRVKLRNNCPFDAVGRLVLTVRDKDSGRETKKAFSFELAANTTSRFLSFENPPRGRVSGQASFNFCAKRDGYFVEDEELGGFRCNRKYVHDAAGEKKREIIGLVERLLLSHEPQ